MELLIGIVGIEDQDPLYTTAGRRGLRGKKTHLNTFRGGFRVHISVHAAFTRDKPVQVQEGIMQEKAFQEIAAGTDAALWDLFDIMGGAGSMDEWVKAGLARPDHVHFTPEGYTLLGNLLFNALMDRYAEVVR